MDVMVHIDSEDDLQAKPNARLPQRHLLLAHLGSRLGTSIPPTARIVLHYLSGKVDAEILVEDSTDIVTLQRQCTQIAADDKYFRSIRLYQNAAPN
jgi:hypothetical protein